MNSLRICREKAGITQTKVAEKLGISNTTVSMWETDGSLPRAGLLLAIAGLYGCTVDDLLAEQGEAA